MTWSGTFLQTYIQPDIVNSYREKLTEDIFICMEMSRQSYNEVMDMPASRFNRYIKWKSKLLDDKQKIMDEQITS